MNDPASRRRRFVRERLLELVAADAPLTRRARTLSTRAAIDEVLLLADAQLRALERDPSGGAHGIAMLPEMVDEANQIITEDIALRSASFLGASPSSSSPPSSLSDALREALECVKDRSRLTEANVEHLRGLNHVLHGH